MAAGQLTFLKLCNRVLMRLGKAQVPTAGFTSLAGDTWGGIARDSINDAQQEIYKEHDWSTLQTTVAFTTSSRTYDLSTLISTFGREVALADTTNRRILTPVNARDIDESDPGLDGAGTPTAYAIDYPNLLFNRTPTATDYRLRYFKRPTTLSAATDLSILPEFCDMALVWWVVWQMQASREDAQDGGEAARAIYQSTLARAIGQDRRRMDQVLVLQPVSFGSRNPYSTSGTSGSWPVLPHGPEGALAYLDLLETP